MRKGRHKINFFKWSKHKEGGGVNPPKPLSKKHFFIKGQNIRKINC